MSVNSIKKIQFEHSDVGLQFYCKCSINNVQLLPQNIISLSFTEWIFDIVPRLEMTFIDDGRYFDKFPLQENDIIKIEISRNSNDSIPVVIEFALMDYNLQPLDPNESRNCMINLTGLLKNKELFFPVKSRSFPKKTSDQVLKSVALDCGFSTDIRVKGADTMTWLQANMNNFQLMSHVLERAYVSDRDTSFGFVDRKNQFVYTSLNTELKKKVSIKMRFDPERVLDIENAQNKPENLHNKGKQKELYFSNYKYVNLASSYNKLTGYGIEHTYWNLTKLITKEINSDSHPLTKYSFKEKENAGKISKSIQYPYHSDNQHSNYFTALTQNEYLRDTFFNSCLLVFVNANEDINLFDKPFIVIPTLDGTQETNEVHSGEYVVGGIYHEVGKDSIYKMIVALFRNGMNKSSFMKDSDVRLNR